VFSLPGQHLAQGKFARFELSDALRGVGDVIQISAGAAGVLQHSLDRAAVLPLEAVDQIQPFLHFFQAVWIEFDALQVAAQVAPDFRKRLAQGPGLFSQFELRRVDARQ
jgi:hypothetical protein